MRPDKTSDFNVRFDRTLKEIERVESLRPLRQAMLSGCYVFGAVSLGVLVLMGKGLPAVYPGLVSVLLAAGVIVIDTHGSKVRQRAQALQPEVKRAEAALRSQPNTSTSTSTTPHANANASGKVPLPLGFLNLMGPSGNDLLMKDAAALSEMFLKPQVSRDGQDLSAPVLFVYGRLNAAGGFEGRESLGIRQLAQQANASIVVLASPNPIEHVKAAATATGPKVANLVFTVDRNGPGFSTFFHALFQRMRAGEEMLQAWVALEPQGPSGGGIHAPDTMLVAEAGKVAFKR